MNISGRVFSYPVLSSEKNDYKESYFKVECSIKPVSLAYLELEIEIELGSKYIQNLINHFEAEYVVHLECSSTGFRKILKSHAIYFKENIPIANLMDKFEIVVMIISKKEISNFSSDEFQIELQGEEFFVVKSSILAYENMAFNLMLNQTEFTNGDSIFSISKDLRDTVGKMNVDLGNPKKIIIKLSKNDYQTYVNLSNKKILQTMLQTMLILPALLYVISELKLEDGIETYDTTEWYQSLKKAYELKGLDFKEALEDERNDALTLAQELMEFPIGKTFENINLFDHDLEED